MKHLSKIIFAAEMLASLLILGAVFIWAPVCEGLLTLANGAMTHMKCFYTGQVSVVLALILLITAIAALFSKTDHNKVQWVIIVIGIMLIASTFESIIGIGICKMAGMACHVTALWVRISGVIAIAGGLVDIFANSGNSQQNQ